MYIFNSILDFSLSSWNLLENGGKNLPLVHLPTAPSQGTGQDTGKLLSLSGLKWGPWPQVEWGEAIERGEGTVKLIICLRDMILLFM